MSIQPVDGWSAIPLRSLLELLESGSRPRGGVRGIQDGIPSIGGEHLNAEGGFDLSSIKYVPRSFYDRMRRGHIEQSDILVVKDGATTGKVSLVREDFPHARAVVNEHVFICRPNESIVPRFLFWFLWSRAGQEALLQNFQGSAQGGINQGFADNVAIPVAPIAEQRRIVEAIDALLARVSVAQVRLRRAPQLLERFRQVVLAAAYDGRLTAEWRAREALSTTGSMCPPSGDGQVAESQPSRSGWQRVTIGDVTECLDSQRRPINKAERLGRVGSVPYYGANGQVGWIDDYLFDEDLVLVVEDETFVGRRKPFSYIIRGRSWVNNHAHVLRPINGMSCEYLHYCLAFYDFVPLTSGTTGRRKLTKGALLSAPLMIAPAAEQKEIVRRVDVLMTFADTIERRMSLALTTAGRLPQAVLSRAFAGELVPTEAELARKAGRKYETVEELVAIAREARAKKAGDEDGGEGRVASSNRGRGRKVPR